MPPSGYYYTIGKNVLYHFYVGGGIYAIFNPNPDKGVINIECDDISGITIDNVVFGSWSGSSGFVTSITHKGKPIINSNLPERLAANKKYRICSFND
jgi:hypothetical protein